MPTILTRLPGRPKSSVLHAILVKQTAVSLLPSCLCSTVLSQCPATPPAVAKLMQLHRQRAIPKLTTHSTPPHAQPYAQPRPTAVAKLIQIQTAEFYASQCPPYLPDCQVRPKSSVLHAILVKANCSKLAAK